MYVFKVSDHINTRQKEVLLCYGDDFLALSISNIKLEKTTQKGSIRYVVHTPR